MASLIDEIRNRIDLVELISEYLNLKKVGSSYRALCPFHAEKTPSFYVSPQKQIWKCFGCNRGGEHFKFLMEYEHIDFKEALKILAQKAGIELKKIPKEIKTKIDEILEVHRIAAKFFQEKLQLKKEIIEYLKKRGLKNETIEEFQIGWAEGNLPDFLLNLGFEKSTLIDSGIFYEKDFELFNRFEKRIIFPIKNSKGLIVAFSGRSLDEEPKYLNSPDTLIFKKGENFYGINLSLPFIKESKEVFLVEGFFDLILAWQSGIKNILAILGTALTPYQVKILKRYINKIIFSFDNDEGGEMATLRSAILVGQTNIKMERAVYEKKDLGEFLLDHKAEEILREDLLDFWLKRKETKTLMEILPIFLASLSDIALRVEYLKKIQQYDIIKIEWLIEAIERVKKQIPKIQVTEELPTTQKAPERRRYDLLVESIISISYGLGKKDLIEEIKEFLPENLESYEDLWEMRFEYEKSLNNNLEGYLEHLIRELKKEFYRNKIKEISQQQLDEGKVKSIMELTKKLQKIYEEEKRKK